MTRLDLTDRELLALLAALDLAQGHRPRRWDGNGIARTVARGGRPVVFEALASRLAQALPIAHQLEATR
jgi:hypothetical protein